MGLSQSDRTDEDHVGFAFDKAEAKEVADLLLVEFLGPVPAILIEGFFHRETRQSDSAFQGSLLTGGDFALEQTLKKVRMSEVFARRLGGQLGVVGPEVSKFKVLGVFLD